MSDEECREVNYNYFKAVEDIGIIENRLASLGVMIDTICLGLEQEQVEQQVIDCLKCIGMTVRDIMNTAEERVLENMALVDMDMIDVKEA